MDSPVLLVSSSVPVRDAVERVLARTRTPVRHEVSAASGAAAAREFASVVICTFEADWRGLIQTLNGNGEIGPPVVILMPEPDPRLWADALMHGAFDALALTDDPDKLLATVDKARARLHRARSVREALKQNSAARSAA